jgi:hypothetical protein
VEQLAEIADESVIPPPPPEEELPELEPATCRAPVEMFPVERVTDDEPVAVEATPEETEKSGEAEPVEPEERTKRGRGRKAIEPRKRVAKSDEKPAKGTTRKAAQKTPAKRTRRRGEDEETTERESTPEFQRVTDEDMRQEAGELLKDAMVQEKIIEQVHTAEFQTGGFQPEPEPEWRVGSLRSLADSGSGFQRVVDENAEAAAREEASRIDNEFAQEEASRWQPEETKASPFRHLSDVVRDSTDAFNPGLQERQRRQTRAPVPGCQTSSRRVRQRMSSRAKARRVYQKRLLKRIAKLRCETVGLVGSLLCAAAAEGGEAAGVAANLQRRRLGRLFPATRNLRLRPVGRKKA